MKFDVRCKRGDEANANGENDEKSVSKNWKKVIYMSTLESSK